MGTHASTRVVKTYMGDTSVTLVNMYRQYDGYPDGHGVELAKFLNHKLLVNGLPSREDRLDLANGLDDLAAQIVVHFKKEPGDFYLSGYENKEEYDYEVYEKDNEIRIKATGPDLKFDGTPDEFLQMYEKVEA